MKFSEIVKSEPVPYVEYRLRYNHIEEEYDVITDIFIGTGKYDGSNLIPLVGDQIPMDAEIIKFYRHEQQLTVYLRPDQQLITKYLCGGYFE